MPGSEQYNSWLQIQEGVRETEKSDESTEV